MAHSAMTLLSTGGQDRHTGSWGRAGQGGATPVTTWTQQPLPTRILEFHNRGVTIDAQCGTNARHHSVEQSPATAVAIGRE